jgi:UDP-N-acetyl-D-mannosaminuronic acid dehydrogenase
MTRVCVVGLGYIGLPTAALLADAGFDVVGVDVRVEVVDALNKGTVCIEEPGLSELVLSAIDSGRLVARTAPEAADVFLITVQTPLVDGHSDLSFVESATADIVGVLARGNLVVLESTVPPRTSTDVVAPILERSGLAAGTDFDLAHCPERVLPGHILRELVENDRVIGGLTQASAQRAVDFYAVFVRGDLHRTDLSTAELVKVAENTFRDVNIAFANELSRICDRLGIDAWEAIELANHHPRVHIHSPGPGVGGHCLPLDPWFIVEKAPELAPLIQQSRRINDTQPEFVADLVARMLGETTRAKVALLGIAYKANVDDSRESPGRRLAEVLEQRGFLVAICDPHVSCDLATMGTLEQTVKDADIAVLVTDHDEFKCLSPEDLAGGMRQLNVLDTRNVLAHEDWRAAGFVTKILGSG